MSGSSAPKQTITNQAPTLSSIRLQSSAQGSPLALVYGRTRINPNIIWYGAFHATPHTANSSSGGKGGADNPPPNVTYSYQASLILALARGVISRIPTIWRNKDVLVGGVVTALSQVATETHTVLGGFLPHVVVDNASTFDEDISVYDITDARPLGGGEYTVTNGVYSFNGFAVGHQVRITYRYSGSGFAVDATAQLGMTLFNGDTSQVSWPYLDTNFPDEALANRGLAYIAVESYPLGTSGALANHSFEVEANLQYGSIASLAKTFTADASTDTMTSAAHGFVLGRVVKLTTTGALPPELHTSVEYFVVNPTTNTYQLSASVNGSVVDFTTAGTGTHTATPFVVDAEPSAVMTDYLTASLYGSGFDSGYIGDLTAFRNYCIASGIFVSPWYNAQDAARTSVLNLISAGFSAGFFSEGKLKVVPYCEQAVTGNGVTFTPNTTPVYDLTDDDFMPGGDPVQCSRSAVADAYNSVSIKYRDRANNYNDTVVEAKDQSSIDLYGLRAFTPLDMPEITEASTARLIAQQVLQRVLYIRNLYQFTLPISFLLLEPMDIVTLTDSGLGLSAEPVRITSIEENEDGSLQIEAEEMPDGVHSPALYSTQEPGGYNTNYNAPAGPVVTPLIIDAPGALTVSGFELWLAIAGGDEWGGADIWVSTDGDSYMQKGTIYGPSRYGVSTAIFPEGGDPDTVNTLSVDLTLSKGSLLSGTQTDADNLNTLCFIDGELIAYQDAALTAAYEYDLLTYIRRGVCNTPVVEHAGGTDFMRCDQAMFRHPYDPTLVGTTIYFKFVSFNQTGGGREDLANVPAYSHLITGGLGAPDDVSGFFATQNGNLAVFQWDIIQAANIEGYDIRYNPRGTNELSWNDATPLTRVTKGTQITTAKVPPGDWMFLMRARDTSLRYSLATAHFALLMVNANTVVASHDEQPDWLGTLTGLGVHWTGFLYPLSNSLASAGAGYEIFDRYVYDPVSACMYEAPEIDLGFDGKVRLYGEITSLLGAGETTGVSAPMLELDYRTSAGSYDGYEGWTIGEVVCRYFKERLVFAPADGELMITAFVPTADKEQRTENHAGVTVAPGGSALTYDTPFHSAPVVQATAISGTALYATANSVTDSGFTAHVFDSTGADVGGTINWSATGA